MELAIATDYKGESTCLEDIKKTLANISKAGFTHIHWCHEWDGDYTYARCEMELIKKWMDEYGLKAKALHATKGTKRDIKRMEKHYRKDYTSNFETARMAGVELIKNRIDLAECIGATEIVLHLYVPFISIEEGVLDIKEFYANVEKSFNELMPYCLQRGIRICVENMFDMPENYMIQEWDWIINKYPKEFIGFCLDSGHANMLWHKDTANIIRKYADRIFAVHLHDNFGAVDYHMLPKDGNIEWEKIMQALAETKYELPLTLELGNFDGDEMVYLKRAYKAGEWLDKLYKEAKNK